MNIYGKPPYHIALIHGGPGAAGEMAPVARELSTHYGVLEPHQTAMSIDGQVEELHQVLEMHATLPVTLIGFSWGAWLSYITAARYPTFVKKLILVSSGPFEQKYRAGAEQARLSRLSDEDRAEFETLGGQFAKLEGDDKNTALARLGMLAAKADTYDAIEGAYDDFETLDIRADIFQSVWPEAAELRRSGQLLAMASEIRCPVIAIHGDYDSHSADGVHIPLSNALTDFRFILLERCGHKPWIEQHARQTFYEIIRREV